MPLGYSREAFLLPSYGLLYLLLPYCNRLIDI